MSNDLWTSEAKRSIEEKELDKHLKKSQDHYFGLADGAMEQLKAAAGPKADIQRGDLYNVLQELVALDVKLIKALKEAGISDARRGKWFKWFTLYVVEEYWETEDEDDD
jgi:hypothetical protein